MNSMRMCSTLADVQTGFARAWFSAANIFSLGYLSPVSNIFDRTCDYYSSMVHDVDEALDVVAQQPALDEESMRSVIRRRESEHQQKPMSSQEQEMIARTKPDYSNLRRAANGEDIRPKSILDDDSLWTGHSAMAKSAHRYDAGASRERRIQEQTEFV